MNDSQDGFLGDENSLQVDSRLTQRLVTGIDGLDDILHGGLPVGHLYLVEGNPGTGKTTLALQFLLEGVRRGEKTLYVTLSESKEELEQSAQISRVVDGSSAYS
jgi:circadian clock protein KaiC